MMLLLVCILFPFWYFLEGDIGYASDMTSLTLTQRDALAVASKAIAEEGKIAASISTGVSRLYFTYVVHCVMWIRVSVILWWSRQAFFGENECDCNAKAQEISRTMGTF